MRDIRVTNLPMGYEFRPTEKELVDYLKMKIQGSDSKVDEVIATIDIYKFEPENLPDKSKTRSDDPEWFFISPPEKKYRNSKRNNRATKFGHWKVTGIERDVTDWTTNTVIGKKRTLVFHEGHSSPKKTNCAKKTDWVLHEYHLIKLLPDQKELFLYRLKNNSYKNIGTPKCEDSEPSSHLTTDFEDQAMEDATPKNDTPTCEESEPTNQITIDFEDQAVHDTTHKIDTPKCDDNGPSSNLMTDFEENVELKAIPKENYPEFWHDPSFWDDPSFFSWLQEDFLEKEANALDASNNYSNPFSKPQFLVGPIQQEQDIAMNCIEEYLNYETYNCFNADTQQTSLKRSYDKGGVSSDTDTEAIQRRVKNRYSCAIGETFQ